MSFRFQVVVLLGFSFSILFVCFFTESNSCSVTFIRKGCFEDRNDGDHRLSEILFTDRDTSSSVFSGRPVGWNHWENYILKLACRCAEESNRKRSTVFGLQRYGRPLSSFAFLMLFVMSLY